MGGALTDSGLVFQSSGQVETGGEAAEPAPRSGILGHHCGSCARASRGLPRWLPGTGPAHGRSYAGFVQPDGSRDGPRSVSTAAAQGRCGGGFLLVHAARHAGLGRLLEGLGKPVRAGRRHRRRTPRCLRRQRRQPPRSCRRHLSRSHGSCPGTGTDGRPLGGVQLLASAAVTMARGWVPNRPEPRQGGQVVRQPPGPFPGCPFLLCQGLDAGPPQTTSRQATRSRLRKGCCLSATRKLF